MAPSPGAGRRTRRACRSLLPLVLGAFGVASCALAPPAPPGGAPWRGVEVVAAENFWGSIAAQLGGTRVRVVSLVDNPAADPHSYEPTPADARAVAGARMVIVNGLGYDPWAVRLAAADSSARVLDVGRLLHLPEGSNPHRWYDPADVERVIRAVTAGLGALDPAGRAYFAGRERWYEDVALGAYHSAIARIRARYPGTPVGASESIFALQAPALGLDLVTPARLLRAVSEGSDLSAADKRTVDDQIRSRRIRLYVYNVQNLTPDVQAQLTAVRRAGIPAVTITETLSPAGATFQDWQTRQLEEMEAALAEGRRR